MKRILVIFLFFSLAGGCASTLVTERLKGVDNVPNVRYDAYLYSSGESERFRAVLLLNPDSKAEVVYSARQVEKAPATVREAIAFMQKGVGHWPVEVRRVELRGSTVGYLLLRVRSTGLVPREHLEVNLFEKDGKIHFSAWEQKPD